MNRVSRNATETQPRRDSGYAAGPTGPLLVAVRAAWIVFAMVGISVFVASLPPRLQAFMASCPGPDCLDLPITIQQFEAIGLTSHSFAVLRVGASVLITAFYCSVAALIFWRRSGEWIGLLVSAWLIAYSVSVDDFEQLRALQPIGAWILQQIGSFGFGIGLVLIFFLFPDGRFVPRWSKWPIFGFFAIGYVDTLFPALNIPELPINGIGIWIAFVLSGVIAQIYRYRSVSSPAQRQQSKWAVFALLFSFSTTAVENAARELGVGLELISASGSASFIANFVFQFLSNLVVPIGLMFSILRYRLYDIDLIIRRTVQYTLITISVALMYASFVLATQGLLRSLTGQESTLALVISTLAIAALFNPLRTRIQRFVDLRFYRTRYDAQRTLSNFSMTTQNQVGMTEISHSLLHAVNSALQPDQMSLWLASGEDEQASRDM